MQAVDEGGGGVEEGFERAEQDLIENASHGEGRGNPERDAIDNESAEAERSTAVYGEPDQVNADD
jgi:hypothetical protein